MTARRRLLPAGRLVGVDVARGLAILGMLAVHLSYPSPLLKVPEGRSTALFAVLAGVSLVLVTGGATRLPRVERLAARAAVLVRGVLIALLGLALWTIPSLGFAVILDVWGALFVLLVPVLFAGRRTLLILAVIAATVGAAIVQSVGFAYLTPGQRLENLPSVWLVSGEYPGLVLVTYPLIGMIAARSDLSRARTLRRMILIGAVMAAVGYGVGNLVPGQTSSPHTNTVWEVVGSGGFALVVIGGLQLLVRVRAAMIALSPIAVLGSMPLTVYSLQVVAVLVLPFSYLDPRMLATVSLGSIVFALIWRRLVGRGPIESLVALCSRSASSWVQLARDRRMTERRRVRTE